MGTILNAIRNECFNQFYFKTDTWILHTLANIRALESSLPTPQLLKPFVCNLNLSLKLSFPLGFGFILKFENEQML